ncbi:MAG: BON domain-containing protein, partial [Gammaproteobacteria bacterium]
MSDMELESRRRNLIIFGSLILLLVSVFCLWGHVGKIERDIHSRSLETLHASSADVNYAQVTANGRSVKLVGTVPSEQAKQQAGEEVVGLSGVSSVDNRLAVVGPALAARATQTTPGASLTPPRFSIFSGERTTLRGSVPDQASADAALAAAAATFGAGSVIDRLVPDRHVSNLPWVAPVLTLGPLLKDVTHGSLEVDGLTLTLRGAVDTAEQRDRLAQAAMEA